MSDEMLFCTSDLTLGMTSNEKSFNIKVVHLVETVEIAFGLVFIRGCVPSQKGPARHSQSKPNSFGKFG